MPNIIEYRKLSQSGVVIKKVGHEIEKRRLM